MDNIWDDVWDKKKVRSDYSIRLYAFLRYYADNLQEGANVVEIGCGSGQGLAQFNGFMRVGLDKSKQSLMLANRLFDGTVIRGDGFYAPFKDNSFDFTFNSGVIEHFKYPKSLEFLNEMVRITKTNGLVFVVVPNKYCLWYRMFKAISQRRGKWQFGYEEHYSYPELSLLFARAGLRPIKRVGLLPIPPLADNNRELVSEQSRRKLMLIDNFIPLKGLVAYGLGLTGRKIEEVV